MAVNGGSKSRSSETNWTVVSGSLVNSVTLESSFGDDDPKSPAKRCPLILRPTAEDSTPCEITISFAQTHELRQIYVKSTARVYEIYSQSNLRSEKEYIWTVRCSAAVATDFDDEAQSASSNGSHDNSSKPNLGNEDEWVKVKAPDSSLASIKQEYFEATAQISDIDPCISVTIRFVSVQSKDSVFIDEVYVFADPVESTEPEKQTENSNGNSLMAMLLPSLSLMSKAKNSTTIEDNHKKPDPKEIQSEPSCSSSTAAATKAREREESLVNDRVERSLDQLFSRIGRIEDMFLRLEENLMKPMISIEARLGRVEQQLVELVDRHDKALNFSNVLSDSNSFHRNGSDHQSDAVNTDLLLPGLVIVAPEFSNCDDDDDDVAEISVEQQRKSLNSFHHSENDHHSTGLLLPSVVMTAPEFSNFEEDDDDDDVAEISVAQPPKRALTVDDALAAALAGLMICTPALSIKVPEFMNDEDIEAIEMDSPRAKQDLVTDGIENETAEDEEQLSNEVDGEVIGSDDTSGIDIDFVETDELQSNNVLHSNTSNTAKELTIEETGEAIGIEKIRNALEEILESSFATTTSVVDFEMPVLDVKFLTSSECHENNFSLEALLSDLTGPEETEVETSHDIAGPSDNEERCCDLISVEDSDEPVGPGIGSKIFVDFSYCTLQKDETPLASGTTTIPCSHEAFPTTLI